MNELSALAARLLTGAKRLNKKLILVLVGIVAISAYLLNNSISSSTVESAIRTENSVASEAVPLSSNATITKPQFYVHLVGEIANPGIYAVDSGSRVVDALILAGGFSKRADESSINLARLLTDGEQIIVLKKGASNSQVSPSSIASGQQSTNALISLNRGSQAELEQLPGVGPTLAQRIIDWRSANGGFKSKLDLQNVAGIGDKMFAAIEPKVSL